MKLLVLPAITLAAATASYAGDSVVPVQVGSIPGMDACTSNGVVAGLRTSLLTLRSGPAVTYRQTDYLANGQELFLCSVSPDGKWHGVVYSSGRNGVDCGVSSPVNSAGPYHGPCKSGWVNARWIKVTAG